MSTGAAATPAPAAKEQAKPKKISRGRRIAVWVLIAAATILAFASSLTVWVKRQALSTNAVENASGQMLDDPAIRNALSIYLVDQLYSNTDVTKQLEQKLPANLQPLAAPLAGALRQLSVQAANQLLARPRVQQLFRTAVGAAHAAFIRIVNGNAKRLSSEGGVVYLDLRPLMGQLADQVGFVKTLTAKLPPNAGKIEIMKQNQLDAIQTGASVLKALTVLLVIAVFGLYAIAVFVARGFRRATLRNIGVSFALVGIVLLLVRRVAGNMVVDSLSSGGEHKVSHDVWLIATSLLSDLAYAAIGYGLLVALAAVLAGPTRPATWVRAHLAPVFREHVGLTYIVVGVLYLLVILWAPTRAQTEWISALVLGAALFVGVEVFRRETVKEFPGEPAAT
jgi:hypothetical protein